MSWSAGMRENDVRKTMLKKPWTTFSTSR